MPFNLKNKQKNNIQIKIQVLLLLLISLTFAVSPALAQPSLEPPTPESPEANPKIYLPMLKLISDLYISNLEITQAVQNLSNPVNLVANRTTLVRVYARTSKPMTVSNLQATLTAYRGSTQIGKLTLNGGTAYPASTSLDSLRASNSKSFNFQLPASWITAGTITLAADLDTANIIPESTENNVFNQNATFNSVPVLNVIAVPVEYYDYKNGRTYPPPSTSWLDEALYRMYPVHDVNVTVHAAHHFEGNLLESFTDWRLLLNKISNLKDTEGQPESTVYYGVIPLLDNYGQSWFNGKGVVGYGWMDWRASIGVTKATIPLSYYYWTAAGDDYAAHEIGHNFDREHAPCGDVEEPDPNYLYPDGIIGQYGFKVSQLPSQVVVDKTWTDIMGYCDNEWISDYTYRGLYVNQVAVGSQAAQPETESLYIRVNLGQDSSTTIQPVYRFSASPSDLPENSEYAIQFVDDQGKPVAEYPVRLLKAEEHGVAFQSIRARLPLPDAPFSMIKLIKSGEALSSRNLSTNAMVAQEAPELAQTDGTLTLSWSSSGQPALVRYSTDSGKSWITLGVDIQANEMKVPLTDLPNGPLLFQIVLADGSGSWALDYTP